MGAPPPDQHRHLTPELMPPLPRMPPAPPSDDEGGQCSQMDNLPPGYAYSHAPLPSAQFFNLDAYAKDSKHNKDCNPDLLPDEGTSTG